MKKIFQILLTCFVFLSCFVFPTAHAQDSLIQDSNFLNVSENYEKGIYNYTFGTVKMNFSERARFTITNNLEEPIHFLNSSMSGVGFSYRHLCSGELAPKSTCVVVIEFAPFFEGFHRGIFRMEFDHDKTIQINLTAWAEK